MIILKENLVALCWGDNTCCTTVCEISEVDHKKAHDPEDGDWFWPKLELNLKTGTWKAGEKVGVIGSHFSGENMGRCWNDCQYGLIGIYDRTNIDHLDCMVHDAQTATE